jgi:hypothetical protein
MSSLGIQDITVILEIALTSPHIFGFKEECTPDLRYVRPWYHPSHRWSEYRQPIECSPLMVDNHLLFGEFQIHLEPTGRPHEYSIHSAESGVLSDPYFPVTRTLTRSPNDTINMPSLRLLGVHRAIHYLKTQWCW